jgi:uncharacterized membrane protein
MNGTHFHLLFNHLPILGSVIGGLILLYAILVKSERTITAAYVLLVTSAIGGTITYFTGETAEETVEDIAGISNAMLDQHEDLALFAFICVGFVGVASLIGLYLQQKKSTFAPTVAWVTFLGSIVAFSILAATGYTGGQIRHTEISQSNPGVVEDAEEEEDHDSN